MWNKTRMDKKRKRFRIKNLAKYEESVVEVQRSVFPTFGLRPESST